MLAGDFRALSLFRICFAGYLLIRFWFHDLNFFADFYGEEGVLPVSVLTSGPVAGINIVSPLLRALDTAGLQHIIPILLPPAALAFGIGYRTRWANAILLLLYSYLFWRNPYVRNGAEYLAHLLLVWCLFLPMDRYWSIDAPPDPQSRNRPYPAIPFLAIRLQISSLYVFAGLFKLASPEWVHGIAVSWSLQDNIFGAKPAGLFLVEHAPKLLYVADLSIIAFQLAFPLLIYCPWRNNLTRAVGLIAAAATHLSFILCLSVGGFPYLCLIMLLLLVPDAWLDRVLGARWARLSLFSIFHEANGDYLRSPATVVSSRQTYLVASLARLLDGRILVSPLNGVDNLIGRHRRAIGSATRFVVPFSKKRDVSRPAQAFCALLAALALLVNVAGIERPAIGTWFVDRVGPQISFRLPQWVTQLAIDLQVWQQWPLFVPPPHWGREYRVVARLADGTSVDLMTRVPVPWFRLEASERVAFADDRWLKFFTQLQFLDDQDWAALGHYLCRQAHVFVEKTSAVLAIELISTTRPINNTPALGMPPDQNRQFDCASASLPR